MKKLLVLSTILALFLCSMAMAANAKTSKPAAPAAQKCMGTVKSFEGSNLTLTAAKGDHSFVVDGATKITLGGKNATESDIKAGEKATVTFVAADGKNQAKAVSLTAPKPSPKTK